jgi:hypothetical protein
MTDENTRHGPRIKIRRRRPAHAQGPFRAHAVSKTFSAFFY